MKLVKTSVLTLSLLAGSVAAWAQTAEEIVSKHLTAIGGEEAWKKIETIKMDGSMSVQGMEMPINISIKNKKAWRMDMTIMGMANYQIVTDKEGWMYFPVQQQEKPEPLPAEMVSALQGQLDIAGDLVGYKEKGSKIEFVGKDKIDEKDVYKVKLTDKAGKEKTMFFDASNYYLIREVQIAETEAGDQEMANNFSNFQKLPEGIVVPMTMESPQGPVTFKSIVVNQPLDDNLFKPSN